MTNEIECIYTSDAHSTTLTVITKMKPEPTKPAPLHEYFDTIGEAKRQSLITGQPWFTSYIEDKKKFSVRKATGG